jgi:hypothetical protein
MESYYTVDSIVKGCLVDIGENTISSKYQRFLHWGLEAIADFHFDSAQEVKTEKLEMNDIKQVELPIDFVDLVKIGIQCGDRIKTFSVADNINLLHNTNDCGNPVAFDGCGCSVNSLPSNYSDFGGYYFFNYNENGENLGGLYGVGGGYNSLGYYKIIRNQSPGVIQFTSEVNNTNVYLEYISTGFNPSEQTVVNPYAAKLIKEYIHWRRLWFAGDPRAQKAEEMYYAEYNRVRHRLSDFSIKDVLELSRRYYGQAIKG